MTDTHKYYSVRWKQPFDEAIPNGAELVTQPKFRIEPPHTLQQAKMIFDHYV